MWLYLVTNKKNYNFQVKLVKEAMKIYLVYFVLQDIINEKKKLLKGNAIHAILHGTKIIVFKLLV